MSGVIQDLRYAVRQVRKAPGFAAVAVVTLALGIGANTSIFSVVNGVLLRSLPFPDSDRLVRVWHTPPQSSFPGISTFTISPANFLDWQNQNHVFSSMAIYGYRGFTLTGGDKAEQVDASGVSAEFFSTLAVQPMLGRVFSTEEDQPGQSQVAVVSEGFWQRRYGRNEGLVGSTLQLNDKNYTVVGIMPAGFRFPGEFEIWLPIALDPSPISTTN